MMGGIMNENKLNIDVDLVEFEKKKQKLFVEVKNVTLVEGGIARFPDAQTTRGIKHLHELIRLVKGGSRAAMLYVVQRSDAHGFEPAFDIDPVAVEANYKATLDQKEDHLMPLMMDFTNPSPSLGWRGKERLSLFERGPADLVMALALIHHLAIANNVPLPQLATFFRKLGKWLVIEFVPKGDPQVNKLLATREDIFPNYNTQDFEAEFGKVFSMREIIPLHASHRVMYLMERR